MLSFSGSWGHAAPGASIRLGVRRACKEHVGGWVKPRAAVGVQFREETFYLQFVCSLISQLSNSLIHRPLLTAFCSRGMRVSRQIFLKTNLFDISQAPTPRFPREKDVSNSSSFFLGPGEHF